MNLINKYITDGGKTSKFWKTSGKYQMEIYFAHTHNKDSTDKIMKKLIYIPIYSTSGNKIIMNMYALNCKMDVVH